jgi:hypothetical protein
MLMRSSLLWLLIGATGCGEDAVKTPETDAPSGNRPEPRVIPGGGIGDGAIDGVVNLYVIDDATREPISGAEVRVGDLAGETDATGLFVADGAVGPQDIVVKAAGHRKELWLGANGANVTVNLDVDNADAPPSATLTGSITNFASIPVTHARIALVTYSQTDDLGDPANEIATPAAGPGQLLRRRLHLHRQHAHRQARAGRADLRLRRQGQCRSVRRHVDARRLRDQARHRHRDDDGRAEPVADHGYADGERRLRFAAERAHHPRRARRDRARR